MDFSTRNPATGEILNKFNYSQDIETVLDQSVEGFRAWRSLSTEFRSKRILSLQKAIESRYEELAQSISNEMGKPILESRAEIQKSQSLCEYVANSASEILQDRLISTAATKSYFCYRPLGPILGIMPWNFPVWQMVRFALPALVGGNTVIHKPAEITAGTALILQRIFEEAGFGSGVFQTIFAPKESMAKLIEDPRVMGVSLTGSVNAGRSVGEVAGRALKKCVLELGGSDPYLVLRDANLDLAAEECRKGRFVNGGQSCIAAKRIFVVEAVFDQFLEKFETQVKELKQGDPMNEETQIGPMAREDLRQELHRQVTMSVKAGASLVFGGQIPKGSGFFYPATLLVDPPEGSPALTEELFGPVAVVKKVRDEAAALAFANQSYFALGGAVFTQNPTHGERVAREFLDSGMAFVNEFVKSMPALPFGGYKSSGVGRELGPQGFVEFMNVKTIWVR